MTSLSKKIEDYFQFQTPIKWGNVVGITFLHAASLYTLFFVAPKAKIATLVFEYIVGSLGSYAVTLGVHRHWTHRTFKARLPLRIFFMLTYMFAGQYPIAQWVRDHRTHHKYSDTNADPHSAGRGFWFAHVGWLMMKRHPELQEKGKTIDISDLWEDPVVRFHQKYFVTLLIVLHVLFPTLFPYFILGEDLYTSFMVGFFLRYCFTLNSVWLINSVAHLYGNRPFNKFIKPVQNEVVAFITLGEGWHNFHHVFPWDYKIGEFGKDLLVGGRVIQLFAWLGLAYDLKTASPEMIKAVAEKYNNLPNYEAPYPLEEQDLLQETAM